MFKDNDKISLNLVNAKDIEGNILPIVIKLPIEEKYNLPYELASFDVFEYHEGLNNYGNIVFSIYIGESAKVKDVISDMNNQGVNISPTLYIPSMNSNVCYKEIDNKKEIFAVLNDQDIVVENQKQLISVINKLSDNFSCINNCVYAIKTLSKNRK